MSFIPEGWTYEQKREFRYNCIPYLLETAKFERFADKRVLCVGDGSGIDAVEFARNGAKVSVIDMSLKAIELTRKHFSEAGCRGPGMLVVGEVGDATALPYSSESFDVVYSYGVIHHIVEIEKAVREIARVLKPGGMFMGMVYNKDSLLYAYSILARGVREGLTPDEAMRAYSERNPGCPHSMAYTREDLRKLFLDTKLFSGGVEYKYRYDVIDMPEKRKVPYQIEGKDTDKLGWHLFFEAIK